MKVLVLVVLMALVGCKPQRHIVTDQSVDKSEVIDYTRIQNDSLNIAISRQLQSVNSKLSDLQFNLNQKHKEYSLPDSTGKQYVLSETETIVGGNKKTEERNETYEVLSAQITVLQSSVDSLLLRIKLIEKQKEEIKPTLNGWQNFQIWLGRVLIGLVLAFVGYKVIRTKFF